MDELTCGLSYGPPSALPFAAALVVVLRLELLLVVACRCS